MRISGSGVSRIARLCDEDCYKSHIEFSDNFTAILYLITV